MQRLLSPNARRRTEAANFKAARRTSTTFCAVLAFLTLAAAASSANVASFFPLAHIENDPPEARLDRRVSAVWPFYVGEWGTTETLQAVHPFFSYRTDAAQNMQALEILWPLFSTRSQFDSALAEKSRRTMALPVWYSKTSAARGGPMRVWRVGFPLFYQGLRRAPDEPEKSFLILFPFLWQFNSHRLLFPFYWTAPMDSFAVWPAYGRFRNLFGYDRIEFAAWPLWVASEREGLKRRSAPWPFLSVATRDDEGLAGWGLWPVFGWNRGPEGGTNAYWVWPLGRFTRFQSGPFKGATLNMFLPFWLDFEHPKRRLRYYFPVWGESTSPERRSVAWFWPVYAHTESTNPVYVKDSVFWLLWSHKRGPDVSDVRFFNLFGEKRTPDKTEGYFLWPAGQYSTERDRDRGLTKRRFYALPFVYNIENDWRDPSKPDERRLTIWPFFQRREKGAQSNLQVLKLIPCSEDDPIGRNWEPLWTFYRSERDEDRGIERRSVCGPLYRSIRDASRDASQFNFLFIQYEREGVRKRLSFLGGLLPFRFGE